MQVTWVEHTEYDESAVHQLYRPLISAGMGFGAQRWVATLQRQCECLAILMSSSVPTRDHNRMYFYYIKFISISTASLQVKLCHFLSHITLANLCFQKSILQGTADPLIINFFLNFPCKITYIRVAAHA